MSRFWRVLALIIGAIVVVAVLAGGLFLWIAFSIERGLARATAGYRMEGIESPAGIARQPRLHFMKDIDFNAGPVRLVLEGSITGKDALLIDNQDLLQRMAASASIPDLKISDQPSLTKALFSERIRSRVPAIRIFQNGGLLETAYCLPVLCAADPKTGTSLAPLIAGAAGRAIEHRETFTDHAIYAAAFAQAKSAAHRLTDLPPEPSLAAAQPISAMITLPALLDESADAQADPDIAELIRKRAGLNSWAFIVATTLTPDTAIYDRCRSDTAPLAILGMENVVLPELRIDTDAAGYARLAAITDWSFLPLAPRAPLPEVVEKALASGKLAPECLVIRVPDDQPLRPAVALSPPILREYELSWEEVVQLEAR